MTVQLECTYCGFKWTMPLHSHSQLENMVCAKRGCGHKELKAKDISKNIDYYQGAPPFEVKKSPEREWFLGRNY